ncbi:TlpA family protein disulfide reductase [Brevundimonas goettingensis]|uniref:TlpA family protein disulfide reductase n=1 Tax=Brevundimonas goettingensis TaxID=2774190 RepID=A0A975BZ06_9CAUL|nr:TlpA disulfide reductase family protein [Brevundimonas goettingensis]QTC90558.1 TlpA family protein disulfide reductase [Brevundimonas goettingensis]
MSGSKTAIGIIAGVLLIGAIGGGAFLYAKPDAVAKGSEPAEAPKSALARFATGPLATLETPAATPVAPDYVFKTADGADVRFNAFRGKVVLVNLWAMWCVPCRTEMPTLAAAARTYEGKDLVVLPINVDVEPDKVADAKSFIGVHEPLPLYSDPKFQLPFEFPGKGKMPQTILLDRQGRIRATFAGEADWNSPEARALIDAVLAEG